MKEARLKEILSVFEGKKDALIAILQRVQEEFGYLPEEALAEIARFLKVPTSQVYSVATFFRAFSLKPRGRHMLDVCLGTACHVRGAVGILDAIERETGIKPGETSDDLRFTLETVNCVGACALGPIVIMDGKYEGEMKIDRVKRLLANYE